DRRSRPAPVPRPARRTAARAGRPRPPVVSCGVVYGDSRRGGTLTVVVFFFVFPVAAGSLRRGLVERLHLLLDAVIGQATPQVVEATAVGRRAVAVGLQHLFQTRHAAGELPDLLERQRGAALFDLLEGGRVAKRAQQVEQPGAQAVRRLDQLRLQQ